jgi:hypothetical protein
MSSNRAFFDSAGKAIFIGRFGAAGYGDIEGPGIVGVDFGAFKEFNIREGMKLRIQTQIKNLPNHPNLGNPDTNLSKCSCPAFSRRRISTASERASG